MKLKKVIFGEPMPDKNDPKYKERYEKEVAAGKKFGDKIGLPVVGAFIYRWASAHKTAFLVISFGTVITCFALNVVAVIRVYNSQPADGHHTTAVEQVDSALYKQQQAHKNSKNYGH
ncbi:MAG: hypothetical protein PUF37_00995 [Prevotellaceae bacterium]|nr:hypothetical protein [Prevotellaceae bacterium]